MATSGGPDIERDGLVFGMDTGYGVADNNTATRFYQGKPTTNYGPSNFSDWGTESSAERIATGNTYKGQPTYNCRTVVGESWRGIEKTISGLRTAAGSSGTVTMSCMVRNNNSTAYPMYAYIGHDFGSTRTIAANSNWQRIQWTVNQSSMANDYVEFRPYTNNASVYLEMTMPQVEVNTSTATPWTASSRSSTQSLIDLTKTTDIDVSNVSFDSTGQPTFDGTDDYMQISLTGADLDSGCTIEGVLKRNSTPSAWRTFFNIKPSGATTPFFEFRSLANTQHIYADYYNGTDYNTNAASFTTGDYGHAIATYDGNGNIKMYFNGELVHTKTSVPSFALGTSPRLTIGRAYSNDRYTDIEAPVVKIYNRALSADEVQQNYNAYKNRFNL